MADLVRGVGMRRVVHRLCFRGSHDVLLSRTDVAPNGNDRDYHFRHPAGMCYCQISDEFAATALPIGDRLWIGPAHRLWSFCPIFNAVHFRSDEGEDRLLSI